ncbi:MAG: DUF4038 domain-containing protein [Bacteroidales bacterium]|nr:DUF4038 domain-containing protein [Bacteroidales bacterium]
MKNNGILIFTASGLIALMSVSCTSTIPDTELFRVVELSFEASDPCSNPYVNGPELIASFRGISGEAAGSKYTVYGFWDGGNIWKLRFSPTKTGEWEYRTVSPDKGLNNRRGKFKAISPTSDKLSSNILYHGFLERADTFSWKLSDGTPFFPIGETQWSFSEEFTLTEWKEWMDLIAFRGYNTFMGCCWLGKYTRSELKPFAGREPASDTLLVDFFIRQLDPMVQYANDKGIMMGLVIGGFPDNSQWFTRFKTIERSDRWFRYIIARYSAYNVRWGLFGELNEAVGSYMLEDKSWEWTGDHYAGLVKKYDPYKHPVGSHNTRVDFYAAADDNIDYIKVQEGDRTSPDQYKNAISLRKWKKPLWYEEYWYEMDGAQDVGIQNTYRNFVYAMAFPTMGSLMRNHQGINTPFPPDEAEKQGISLYNYLMANDTGIIRMSYFSDFFSILKNDLDEFVPASTLVSRGECGKFGNNLAVFLEGGGTFTVDLSGITGKFNLTALDIRTGEKKELPVSEGGARVVIDTGIKTDAAILLIKDVN